MATLNYATREVLCKIVYYGAAMGGKTSNLQSIHGSVPDTHRGQLVSLATEAERTLYFDFLPLDLGQIKGFQTKFQLYTVPGQVYYNATRKLVLRGVDGIVFVVDSQPQRLDENLESLLNLEENLAEYGHKIEDIPWVIQYNKRDLPGVMPVEELQRLLNPRGTPCAEASALTGEGVKETLKLISGLVLEKLGGIGEMPEAAREAVEISAADYLAAAPTPTRKRPAARPSRSVASPSRERLGEGESPDHRTAGPPRPAIPSRSVDSPSRERLGEGESSDRQKAGPPRLAIRQRCDVYWRRWKVGTASVEVSSRSNLDGRGEYQLAESRKLMVILGGVRLDTLVYVGEESRSLGARQRVMHVFRANDGVADSLGPALTVWVEKGVEQTMLARRRVLAGELVYVPAGREAPSGLSTA